MKQTKEYTQILSTSTVGLYAEVFGGFKGVTGTGFTVSNINGNIEHFILLSDAINYYLNH